MTSKTNG